MYFLKTALVVAMVLLASAKEETKNRGKRQQIAFYPRRGGRPPPYAVQMEPIVQYSQRDPLYNPSASSKSDDLALHDDPALFNHYVTEPEPIIEIIIKESNESLPTPVPPPAVPQPRPTKEPIQVFYVKYEKKKGYGDSKPRVVYDPPIPALNPVEEHEEIKPDDGGEQQNEEPVHYPTEPPTTEPSTTLRTIIRPESEVYHSGSSGIRVTFGTDQVPPNNHNKRSDITAPPSNSPPQQTSVTALPPPGSPKRQHGPYQSIQPVHPRVPPAFPQQRIVNSFPPHQQLPQNFPGPHQQFQPPPNGPINPPRPQQQRPPITIQGLPEIQQRLPFQSFAPPHRISINHPQQPGFPHSLSVSHQNVHLQNQPPSLVPAGNFNPDLQQQQRPHQHPQQQHQHQQQQHQIQSFKQQEQEKQRYHQEQRRQQEIRQREQLRLQEQHRQQEQQRQQDHQRKLEQQRLIEQQRQADQQRQQERLRQEEQHRIEEQQRFHLEQQRRKQEQENKLLQEQHYRQQLKFGQTQTSINQPQYNQQTQPPPQQQKPGGEIFKAVPKLEQHYAIRENPLHPGPFPPNPQVQQIQYPEIGRNQFSQQPLSTPSSIQQQQQLEQQEQLQQQQQYFLRNPTNNIASSTTQQHQQQQQLQQQNSITKHQTYQNNQQFFSQNLPTPQEQQPRNPTSSHQSIWGRPVFQDNGKQKIYATPISNSNDLSPTATPRTIYSISSSTTPAPTTTTTAPTTTEAITTAAPKNEAKIKENIANLPDEVPDDIREQLLSSGILGNADIQILDYDKVGGIPIENLPPEALANFYGAGGAAATSASEPIPAIAKRPEVTANAESSQNPKKSTFTKVEHATLRPGGVEMKVVHFDPNTAQGQAIADQHIREDATHLKPVEVGTRSDAQYNRYLPLKVSGASFPIPNAPELEGRKITSVVVLAPVDYSGFRDDSKEDEDHDEDDYDQSRQSRMLVGAQPIKFLAGESLKQLVKKPNAENYKKWLEQESRTEPQRQSVVLLVTTPKDDSHGDKEIFMYDVSSQTVSKLSGDLSSAFVNAAESNSDSPGTIDDSAFATY